MRYLLRLFLLFLFPLLAATAFAQKVRISGEVKDAFLDQPLPHVKVSVLAADSTVLVDSLRNYVYHKMSGGYQMAFFADSIDITGRKALLLHATRKGYDDVWKHISLEGLKPGGEIDGDVIKLRKSSIRTLGQATVTATRVKMYYRGDTLVYDADAFKLPDGSMLDALIRQLPGVTLNDAGEIFVQGRKVYELLLGSRSFMRGNKKVLLENLPYYTVKEIKAYDKQSDRSKALGYDVDPRRYVMDVQLKKEYNKGFFGNVEAAGGTQDRYLGRAFLLGFADRLRLSLAANSNNVSETRHIGQIGQWTPDKMPQSVQTVHGGKLDLDYAAKGDKLGDNFYVEGEVSKNEVLSRSRREQFLVGSSPLTLTEGGSTANAKRLKFQNNFGLNKPFYLSVQSSTEYTKTDGNSFSTLDQWDSRRIAALRSKGLSDGHRWNLNNAVNATIGLPERKGLVNLSSYFFYTDDQAGSTMRYDRMGDLSAAALRQYNTNDVRRRSFAASAQAYLRHVLWKRHYIYTGVNVEYRRNQSHNDLYHPDSLLLPSMLDRFVHTRDFRNSYHDDRRSFIIGPMLSLFKEGIYRLDGAMRGAYNIWSLNLHLPIYHNTYDYFRTTAYPRVKQNKTGVEASADFRKVWDYRKRSVGASVTHKVEVTPIEHLVDYEDTSTPLIVTKGNSALRGRESTLFTASYDRRWGKFDQAYHTDLTFVYNHRDIAQASIYDAATGTYTYQPQNISGAYFAGGKVDFSRALNKPKRWMVQTTTEADYSHVLDHARLTGEPASRINTVNTLQLGERASLQYAKPGLLTIKARAEVKWRHARGELLSFSTLDAFDYQYGLSGTYTIRPIGLTLMADAHMFSRRGYGSASLNSDDFVVNASLSQSLLKGKLVVRLEGFDLLHQISNTRYEVNAQGRLETWTRSLPRYAMLHLVYHWNAGPKKR